MNVPGGLAPLSMQTLPQRAAAPVLAVGAFLKNRACLVDGNRLLWSTSHGDLGGVDACRALAASIEQLLAQASRPPLAVAHDLHPDFPSTHQAIALAEKLGVPAMAVQHHHAHIAAVQAEHGLTGPVVGIALDGFGLGSDGHAWGGELLWVDGARWHRLAHLPQLALPGGDRAAREPWRLVAALLHASGRGEEIALRLGPVVGEQAARVVQQMLSRGLHCPPTSSVGRWFDAAAAALGLCVTQQGEAEAAMTLEALAADWLQRNPGFDTAWNSLDLYALLGSLLAVDQADTEAVARGAAAFHLGLADGLAAAAIVAAKQRNCRNVVLGGGCLVNRVLRQRLVAALLRAGLTVHSAEPAASGDAHLALGQAWVAGQALMEAGRASVMPAMPPHTVSPAVAELQGAN